MKINIKKKLIAAVLAATVFSAVAAPVSAADGWNRNSTGWWYQNTSGGYERDGWSRIDGRWYYFDAEGYMKTGWLRNNGNWYYLGGSGAMRTGWAWDGNGWYYLSGSGAMRTGWVKDGNDWYYLSESGKMLSNTLLTLSQGVYYLGASGAMAVGNVNYNGETLTFGSDGALISGNTSGNTDGAASGGNTETDTLVVYFSWSGNTEEMASYIAEKTGGDLYEIEPETPYSTVYAEVGETAQKERDENARPAIGNLPDSVDEYDTILVGYPIWWHTAPMIIGTFLESYDLDGVDIYPFTQSASMDTEQFENSMDFVRENASGANVHDGLFTRSSDTDAIEEYLSENGLLK